jgi:hypothetical protein
MKPLYCRREQNPEKITVGVLVEFYWVRGLAHVGLNDLSLLEAIIFHVVLNDLLTYIACFVLMRLI